MITTSPLTEQQRQAATAEALRQHCREHAEFYAERAAFAPLIVRHRFTILAKLASSAEEVPVTR